MGADRLNDTVWFGTIEPGSQSTARRLNRFNRTGVPFASDHTPRDLPSHWKIFFPCDSPKSFTAGYSTVISTETRPILKTKMPPQSLKTQKAPPVQKCRRKDSSLPYIRYWFLNEFAWVFYLMSSTWLNIELDYYWKCLVEKSTTS